jgi:DNA-binding transcriptional LysR family regulator
MGEVHVGVVPGFLQTEILPAATLNLTRQAQRLTVNYRFGNRTSLLQPLLHGDLDFLIVGIEEDEYASQLVTEPLVQDRNALVVRAGHPILAQPGQRPLGSQAMASALAHHPWLVLSECIPLENMLRQVLRSRGVQFANSVIRTDSFYFFRTSLLASDCIGLTRYDAARLAQKAGHVVELPLASMKGLQLGGSHMIGIVHRREHALSAASKALIKEIRQLTHAAGAAPKSGPTI